MSLSREASVVVFFDGPKTIANPSEIVSLTGESLWKICLMNTICFRLAEHFALRIIKLHSLDWPSCFVVGY